MALPLDTQVMVTSADDDGFNIQVGPDGMRFETAELITMMNGEIDMLSFLKFNIAVRLKLAGVDPNDPIAVKTAIESTTFKYFR